MTWRCIDVDATSYKRHVLLGSFAKERSGSILFATHPVILQFSKADINSNSLICSCSVSQVFFLWNTARHYENTPIQKYRKIHLQKPKIFRWKKLWYFFHISAQNIDYGYSIEPPRRGGSNEYPQSMFWAEIRKFMYTPVNPSFSI